MKALMKPLVLLAMVAGAPAMANDTNAARAFFFSAVAKEVPYDVDGITFTETKDTGVTPRSGGVEYYIVAHTQGPVLFKCDGLVVVRAGVAEEIAPKSFRDKLCRPID